MKVKYLINEIKNEIEGVKYISYGITAKSDNEKVEEYNDISTDKEFIQNLVNSLNDNELDVIHLHDVIEDTLCLI